MTDAVLPLPKTSFFPKIILYFSTLLLLPFF
jgi:hypothetical protein